MDRRNGDILVGGPGSEVQRALVVQASPSSHVAASVENTHTEVNAITEEPYSTYSAAAEFPAACHAAFPIIPVPP